MSKVPGVKESDWKLLRKNLPGWQEAYMDRLNHEYIELLSGEGTPSEKSGALVKRSQKEKYDTGVVADMRRSNMEFVICDLLAEKAITMEDLSDFSEELKARIAFRMEPWP